MRYIQKENETNGRKGRMQKCNANELIVVYLERESQLKMR